MNTLEQVAVWYLRLNGYFTMPNYIAHAQDGAQTDVDVLGVRFPHSREYPDDEAVLQFPVDKIDVVFAEAKAGECKLNGPWKGKGDGRPLEWVLRRVGLVCEDEQVDRIANELYLHRRFPPNNESTRWSFVVRIVCFGKSENKKLGNVTQVLWPDAIGFMRERFQTYAVEKADHNHWDSFGKFLWRELFAEKPPRIDELEAGWHKICANWP
jgi:hypothetical protein